MKSVLLTLAIALLTLSAQAENLQSVAAGSKAEEVAMRANDVFSVTTLKVGDLAYKIVSLDSGLNGDFSSTTMLLVGEGGVGGAAGYESAFQLSPDEDRQNLKSVKVVGSAIKMVFTTILSSKQSTILVQYDKASKSLKVQNLK